MDKNYDFSGWVTRNDLRCSDGRIIRKDAFKGNDGQKVPMVWNHDHTGVDAVLGHMMLENREDGVYGYGFFNESDNGLKAKEAVFHRDVDRLSIYANQLKQQQNDVIHGVIREVSLVLAGANPGAYIDYVASHSEEDGEAMVINYDEPIELRHADEEDPESEGPTVQEIFDTLNEDQKNAVYVIVANAVNDAKAEKEPEVQHADTEEAETEKGGKTVQQIFDTLTEEQKNAVYVLIAAAVEDAKGGDDNEEDENVKHNVFDNNKESNQNILSHSDMADILAMAKAKSVGSLRDAIGIFVEQHQDQLAHTELGDAAEADTPLGTMGAVMDKLFPDYKDLMTGAPETVTRDQGWVTTVMNKIHKSPISRIRTRQIDLRDADLRAMGYKKGDEKVIAGVQRLISRTTDPQTVYRKDAMHRDDILDITDFDVVEYNYGVMRMNLNEEIAMAITVGDGRDENDPQKIHDDHIRPIWLDDELYTIHVDVDTASVARELQGTDTTKHFGDGFVMAEAVIQSSLYAREQYKGSGAMVFICTPHLLNVMLLARDLNGHRMYSSKNDLAAALDVTDIITAEQFAGLQRTDKQGAKHELLGLFVNFKDYYVGAVKGGDVARFSQFDIDFNQEKYLIETRLSGALTRIKSAIALEKPVA